MAIIEHSATVMPGNGIPNGAFRKATDPVANDFAGQAIVGSLCVNTANGRWFSCTATNGTTTTTWALIGAQV